MRWSSLQSIFDNFSLLLLASLLSEPRWHGVHAPARPSHFSLSGYSFFLSSSKNMLSIFIFFHWQKGFSCVLFPWFFSSIIFQDTPVSSLCMLSMPLRENQSWHFFIYVLWFLVFSSVIWCRLWQQQRQRRRSRCWYKSIIMLTQYFVRRKLLVLTVTWMNNFFPRHIISFLGHPQKTSFQFNIVPLFIFLPHRFCTMTPFV